MLELRIDDRLYFQSKVLKSEKTVTHCFTSKLGGLSDGAINGLNLGFRVGDEPEKVHGNYRLVAEDMGFELQRITAGKQTHSENIRVIREEDSGKGVSRDSEFSDVDGLVTDVKNLPLVVYYADCVPVLLSDEEAGVIAAVHSGWRGTVLEISGNAVRIMTEQFGAVPSRIKAAIGPSIGPCCFETGAEVAFQFEKALVKEKDNGKFLVDIWQANKNILLKNGLREENIDVLRLCTICNNHMLYSYRTHKEATGRMGAFISLNKGGK